MPDRQEPSLRARALRHLARREHTRQELAHKLAPHAGSQEELSAVLDEFATKGWLSEYRAAEQIVHSRRSRYGMNRIRRDLEAKGVESAVVGETLEGLRHSEWETLQSVWRKKFKLAPLNAAEKAKQMRFLLGRGFSGDLIQKLFRELPVMLQSDE